MTSKYPIYLGASRNSTAENDSENSDEGAVGGLFRMKNQTKNVKDQVMHECDSSKIIVQDTREWQEILADIKDCFVTGKWTETEDAEALLQLDDQDDGRFLVEWFRQQNQPIRWILSKQSVNKLLSSLKPVLFNNQLLDEVFVISEIIGNW